MQFHPQLYSFVGQVYLHMMGKKRFQKFSLVIFFRFIQILKTKLSNKNIKSS